MPEAIKKAIRLIAIYARVSTSNQEEEQTIKTQIVAIREFAEKNGYTIVQEYIDDGWSGDMLARPQLDQLRQDIKNKIWEAVLVYDPDRLARRYSYQELVMDELTEAGVEVIFVTTPSPKNGEEKILHGVKGLFAEYERAKIAERFRLGKMRKVKEGHLLVSEAPIGYTYIPKQDKRHGYYEVNEREAKIVKMIFTWIVDDKLSIRGVVRRLQEIGIPPRKSKRGVWSVSTLTHLLRSKTYIGEAHYGASYAVVPEKPLKNERYKKIKKTSRKLKPEEEWIKIPAPAIISKELFYNVQDQLKRNFKLSCRNKKNDYLLSGFIRHTCGSTMAGARQNGGRNLYYRCTERLRSFPLPPKCIGKSVNARIVDELTWKRLQELLGSSKLLMDEINQWKERRKKGVQGGDTDIKNLESQLQKLKEEGDRYTRAYGEGVFNIEQLKEYMDNVSNRTNLLKKQIVAIKDRENELGDAFVPVSEEDVIQYVEKTRNALPGLNFEQKRAIVVSTINKVVVNDEELHVAGRIPITAPLTNVTLCSIHRYGVNAIRYNFNKVIPFEFRIKINNNCSVSHK